MINSFRDKFGQTKDLVKEAMFLQSLCHISATFDLILKIKKVLPLGKESNTVPVLQLDFIDWDFESDKKFHFTAYYKSDSFFDLSEEQEKSYKYFTGLFNAVISNADLNISPKALPEDSKQGFAIELNDINVVEELLMDKLLNKEQLAFLKANKLQEELTATNSSKKKKNKI